MSGHSLSPRRVASKRRKSDRDVSTNRRFDVRQNRFECRPPEVAAHRRLELPDDDREPRQLAADVVHQDLPRPNCLFERPGQLPF